MTNRRTSAVNRRRFNRPLAMTQCRDVVSQVSPALADGKQEETRLVEKARLTLNSFMKDNNMGAFRDLLQKADGVLISPKLLKGAFVVGVSGGNAVFLARDKRPDNGASPRSIPLAKRAMVSRSGARPRR